MSVLRRNDHQLFPTFPTVDHLPLKLLLTALAAGFAGKVGTRAQKMDISPLAAGAAERRAGVLPDGKLRAGLIKM